MVAIEDTCCLDLTSDVHFLESLFFNYSDLIKFTALILYLFACDRCCSSSRYYPQYETDTSNSTNIIKRKEKQESKSPRWKFISFPFFSQPAHTRNNWANEGFPFTGKVK